MENPGMSENERRTDRRNDDLHLDNIIASQPEIGPTPPDGGYGWLIVVSAMIYNITVPGLFVMYGFIILKSIRDEDHDEQEMLKIWDADIALVPVLMIVLRLLLEAWCRTVVKVFNMPRFMALAGLCLTVAGVLLSSYSTNANTNDHIVNIFAGLFAGAGCALTGQQTEVIVTHYFRDKLAIAQRLIKMAPALGNCLVPILIGFLSSNYTGDVVIMIYAAILMQNCLFLASFTRPIYIERVLRSTYKMLRDAVEDEDEVIFSNHTSGGSNTVDPNANAASSSHTNPYASAHIDDGDDQIVVFNSKRNAKEILDPVQFRDKTTSRIETSRFSSDFSTMYTEEGANRFSSDFGTLDMGSAHPGVNGYQELESIDRITRPQPLYRETTVNAPPQTDLSYVIDPSTSAGPTRRTASIRKNFITILNMFKDINFYLYTLLHLCTTFSLMIFGIVFPPLIWEQNPTLNIWNVCLMITLSHAAAFCLVMLCGVLPKSFYEKFRLCAFFCMIGGIGFYGIALSSSRALLVLWGVLASFSMVTAGIVQQPLYNNVLNEFDTTATIITSNSIVASFIMIWCISFNYQYRTCFFTAAMLQVLTSLIFFASSFRRRR